MGFLFRSRRETSQGAYTFQIFLEKEQMGQMPTVQQLLETSCLSGDLKFEEVSALLTRQREPRGFEFFLLIRSCNPNIAFPISPSDAILSNGSDAKVWKQVQDVFPHHSLHWAWHHRPSIQLWGTEVICTDFKSYSMIPIVECNTFFNTVFLKSFKVLMNHLLLSQQLRENALSVGIWQSMSVFSVYQIANCSQEESNSTALRATHR